MRGDPLNYNFGENQCPFRLVHAAFLDSKISGLAAESECES